MPLDQQIVVTGQSAAPLDYTVPNAAEILLLVVQATFDGAGATVAFLPAVEVYSDGGVLVGRAVTGQTVGAGGSASVTFADMANAGASAAYSFATAGIAIAGAATTTIVAAVAGKRIKVVQAALMSDGATNVSFGGGSFTAGPYYLAPNTGFVQGPQADASRYWYQTNVNTALTITTTGAGNVGGQLGYVLA